MLMLLNQTSALGEGRYTTEDLDYANQDAEVKISRNQDFWSVLLPLENVFSLCAMVAFLIKYRSCLHAHKPPGEEENHWVLKTFKSIRWPNFLSWFSELSPNFPSKNCHINQIAACMAKCDLASFCVCNCLELLQLNSESPVQMSKYFYIQFIFKVGRALPCPIKWYRKIFLVQKKEIYTTYSHYLLITQAHWIAWNKTEITWAGTPGKYVEGISVLSQKVQGKRRDKRDERSRFCCPRKGQLRCSKEMLSRTGKVGNLKTK